MARRAPWKLECPWCPYHVRIDQRTDPMSGIHAVRLMQSHVHAHHARTWDETLDILIPETAGATT